MGVRWGPTGAGGVPTVVRASRCVGPSRAATICRTRLSARLECAGKLAALTGVAAPLASDMGLAPSASACVAILR